MRIGYPRLGRPGKGAVRQYLAKTTGLSRAQVTRPIGQHRATGRVVDRRRGHSGRPFERVYTAADIRLLAEVDEIAQFEHIGAVARIFEAFLIPVLEALPVTLPFSVLGFHADNGSEYINRQVAELLNKLQVGQFTKSRARRSNDNALVEGKNAWVVRKWLGHDHIPQRFAAQVDAFTQEVLTPYLNFHRPCLFARERRDAKGKVRRTYRRQDVMTPYEKLKSLPDAAPQRPWRWPTSPFRRSTNPRTSALAATSSPDPVEFVDESFGPARALRTVGTARGQRPRVAHRLPPLARLSPTNSTGSTTSFR